jgi:Holliday junction resolvase RusA-like endonuclease
LRLSFTIDGPPEGKRRPRTRVIVKGRKPMATIYSDPADKAREKHIRGVVQLAMRRTRLFVGPVRVTIEAVFEPAPSWSKRKTAEALAGLYHTGKPDLDNVEKSILDGLNPEQGQPPFCLGDDAQVAELASRKVYGSPARTEVTIEALAVGGGLL